MTESRLLIVNADDYGLTTGVSRGIVRAHEEGIVRSTSVLAVAPAFDATVGWLADHPDLGTGAHLAVVGEDPPLLSAREVPTLVDDTGAFATGWRQFLPRMAAGRVDRDDLRREFTAQIERMEAAGLTLDHVDTHQNLHLWPGVRDVVVALAVEMGIPAIRIPRSRMWLGTGAGVNVLARGLERAATRAGLSYPIATAGLDEAGTLDDDHLHLLLERLDATASSIEVGVHPGVSDDPERGRYRWGYLWSGELEALCARESRELVDKLGFELGNFGDLLHGSGPVRSS